MAKITYFFTHRSSYKHLLRRSRANREL